MNNHNTMRLIAKQEYKKMLEARSEAVLKRFLVGLCVLVAIYVFYGAIELHNLIVLTENQSLFIEILDFILFAISIFGGMFAFAYLLDIRVEED